MSVPNTTTFTFQNVTTEIYNDTAAGRNLSAAFTAATGTFDSAYVGSKDRLYNFRNYTHTSSGVTFQGITVEGQTNSTLTIWSNITSGSNTERGICYNTSPTPTTSNSKVANGSGTGEFTTVLTGLSMDITYYMRAYAISGGVTYYSSEISYAIWS